ncbi:MAG: hypothetical protein GVY19_04185 [Bacteroidetes bacterium]|nr:hypothetical protein [Bacteroidota bacterium]
MRNKIFLALLLSAIMFTGCTKQEVLELQLLFGGVIFDDCTNEPLEDVDLRLQRAQGVVSTTSNEDGFFSFGSQYVGTYDLVMHKPGYLNQRIHIHQDEWFEFDDEYENENLYDLSYFDKYWMHPLTETVIANVYKQYGEGSPTAAANVPFTVYLGEYNDPIEVVTDQYGYFEIDSLPKDYSMLAKFDFSSQGIRYKEKISFFSDQTEFIVNEYAPEGNFGIANVNVLNEMGEGVDDFGLDEMIEVTFTQPVDTAMGNPFNVSAGLSSYTLNVDWFDNNQRATIGTDDGWTEDSNHTLNIDAYNLSNKQFINRSISFRTGLGF